MRNTKLLYVGTFIVQNYRICVVKWRSIVTLYRVGWTSMLSEKAHFIIVVRTRRYDKKTFQESEDNEHLQITTSAGLVPHGLRETVRCGP